MILLVVFGHLIEPLVDENILIKTTYMFVYSFHIPVFILIAGALTSPEMSYNYIQKNIDSLLIPFITFTILYEVLNILSTSTVSRYTLNLQPYWILWFLFSLFIWRIILPIIMSFRFPLLFSVIVSLVAGYIEDVGYFFGISRTIYFFPFFILGYQLKAYLTYKKPTLKLPNIFYITVLTLNAYIFWFFREVPYEWIYGSFSYKEIAPDLPYAFTFRLGLYLLSLTSSYAIIILMKNCRTKHSSYGQKSLYVYIWHGFVVKAIIWTGLIQLLGDTSSTLAFVTLFIMATVITLILSSNSVEKATSNLLLAPTKKLLLRKAHTKESD